MNLSLKILDRICLILVVAVPVLCGYLAASEGIKKRHEQSKENEQVSKRLKDLNTADRTLHRINVVLNRTKNEMESLNEEIPESAEIGLFLKEIGALMRERKVALISMQPMPPKKENLISRIPIRLMFKGSFLKVYQVLYDLEDMKRAIVMERMIISKSERAEECQVDLTLNIFARSS